MKVEFSVEEVWQLMNSVLDEVVELKLDRKDTAAIRRWRSEEMTPASPAMHLLSQKVNAEIQGTHDRTQVSPIKKPDWL